MPLEGIGSVQGHQGIAENLGTQPNGNENQNAGGNTGTNVNTPNGGAMQGHEGGLGKVQASAGKDPKVGAQEAKPADSELFEVKVDGKVHKMTREEITKNASLGKAAFKRMEEAGTKIRQAEEFIAKFRQDPMAALDHPALGLSEQQKRDAIEKYYEKKYIQEDKLSPEQKRIQEVEAELSKYRQQDEDRKVQDKQTQAQKLEDHYRGDYQKKIIDALEAGGLPKNPKTVARMAFYLTQAAQNKFNAPMDLIVSHVREDYQNDIAEFTQSLEGEALINFIGPEIAKKIHKYTLQKHREKLNALRGNPTPQNDTPAEPKQKREGRPHGWGDTTKYWSRG